MKKYIIAFLALLLIAFTGLSYAQMTDAASLANNVSPRTAASQPAAAEITPSIVVNNQNLANNSITVSSATSNGPGWVVIHNSINGVMGGIIGFTHVNSGTSRNVVVAIEPTLATANLFVELHRDAGRVGSFEFPSPDAPQMANGQPVTDSFVISAPGQTLMSSQATTAAASQPATPTLGGTASIYSTPNVQTVGSQGFTTIPVGGLGGSSGLSTQAPARLGSMTGLTGAPVRVGAAANAGTGGTISTIGTAGAIQPYVIRANTSGYGTGSTAMA